VPGRKAFQYTILRFVPRIDRGECMNVGVVLYCREFGYLGIRFELDEARLKALAPESEPAEVLPHLEAIAAVIAGERQGGRLAGLPPSERFGWAAAQSSTVLQPAPVHTGMTGDPEATLERLFEELVRV
jgi:hypothetical protein